jgi:hypothetical protein
MKSIKAQMKFVLTIVFLWQSVAIAQYNEDSPNSDRPGQALNPNTVGKNILQNQSGLKYYPWNFSGGSVQHLFGFNTQLRYGFRKRMEVNAGFNFDWGRSNSVWTGPSWFSQVSNIEVGARVNVLNGKGLIPVLGGNFSVFYVPDNGSGNIFGQQIIITQSNRWKKISVNANVGFTHSRNLDADNSGWSYPFVLNVGYNLNDKLSTFVEVFGRFENLAPVSLDGGFTLSLGENIIVDLFGGWIPTDDPFPIRSWWFVEAGSTIRLDFR